MTLLLVLLSIKKKARFEEHYLHLHKEQVGSQCPCPEACQTKLNLFHKHQYKANFLIPKI